jgi:CRP/FNR family transcriptional regulator
MTVPAGSLVYGDEERPRVIVVSSGLLRVFLTSADGRQVTVRYVRRGDVAGLVLVLGGPGSMSIQAMTTSSVVALQVDTLRSLMASDPGVARACAEELTRQLSRALDDIADQAFHSVRQRVAHHLLDLSSADASGRLVVHASQQELADAVGSVREVVTRTLDRLRREGEISTGRDEIVLLDPVRLTEEATAERRVPPTRPEARQSPEPADAGVVSPPQSTRGASAHRRSRS